MVGDDVFGGDAGTAGGDGGVRHGLVGSDRSGWWWPKMAELPAVATLP
jgi:hypothetical protein